MSKFKILLVLFFLTTNQKVNAAVWYVNGSAVGTSSGLSWANAFSNIGSAISAAVNGDDIWVAAGTYYPHPTNPAVAYVLKSGVDIYGSFAGTETSLSQRIIAANPTILSGDINNPGFPNDNSYHLFYGLNISALTTIDGFTIKDANASYSNTSFPNPFTVNGAGLRLNNSKIKISNCKILNNKSLYGAAIYHDNGGDLTIEKCLIQNNYATASNSALDTWDVNLTVTETDFISNLGLGAGLNGNGRCMEIRSSTSIPRQVFFDRCFFTDHYAGNYGAAIYMSLISANVTIQNSLFAGNYSGNGPVIYVGLSASGPSKTAKILNCTIADNGWDSTLTNPNNIYPTVYFSNGNGFTVNNFLIENSIVWNNGKPEKFPSLAVVSNSIMEDTCFTANSVSYKNPFFSNPHPFNPTYFVANKSDYVLKTISQGLNFGNNSFNTSLLDFEGNSRIENGTIDAGCFEKLFCSLPVTINNSVNNLCKGDSTILTASAGNYFSWNNILGSNSFKAYASGVYTLLASDSITGCKGSATITLNFLLPDTAMQAVSVCPNSSYTLPNGIVINNIIAAATYPVTFTNTNGCDSILLINISLKPTSSVVQNKVVCLGKNFTFPDGVVISNVQAPATHISSFLNTVFCDSIITTNLSIVPNYNNTFTVSVCYKSNFTFPDGFVKVKILDTMTHTSLLQSVNGCDSVVRTFLQVKKVDTSITLGAFSIIANQASATYKWYNCISKTIMPGFTNKTFNVPFSGSYAAIVTYNGCTDSSSCYNVLGPDGLLDFGATYTSLNVHPNPAKDVLFMEGTDYNDVRIYNLQGQILITTKGNRIDIKELSPGLYFVQSGGKVAKFMKD
jgi:Secretion system C-terminal sorting domain